MAGFGEMFAPIDGVIMAAVGDDIALTPTVGAAINAKCVLVTRDSNTGQGRIEWLDNIIAKVDISSRIVEITESVASTIGKNWTALYLGKNYTVSDVLPKGDGTSVVILNEAGNSVATPLGWK